MNVWDRAGIELAIPGSAVRLAYVARHVTDCATRPSVNLCKQFGDLDPNCLYSLMTNCATRPSVNLCKQFGDLDPNCLDSLMTLLKAFFEQS